MLLTLVGVLTRRLRLLGVSLLVPISTLMLARMLIPFLVGLIFKLLLLMILLAVLRGAAVHILLTGPLLRMMICLRIFFWQLNESSLIGTAAAAASRESRGTKHLEKVDPRSRGIENLVNGHRLHLFTAGLLIDFRAIFPKLCDCKIVRIHFVVHQTMVVPMVQIDVVLRTCPRSHIRGWIQSRVPRLRHRHCPPSRWPLCIRSIPRKGAESWVEGLTLPKVVNHEGCGEVLGRKELSECDF